MQNCTGLFAGSDQPGVRGGVSDREILEKVNHRLTILNTLLGISLKDIDLDEQLGLALDAILSNPGLPRVTRGVIMLVEEPLHVLVMKASRGYDADVRRRCARVPFGRCACGRAAAKRQVVFVDFSDTDHVPPTTVQVPYGVYSIPIRKEDRILGVLSLYLEPGHLRDPEEEKFLWTAAYTLAGIIERKRAGEQLKRQAQIIDQTHESIVSANLEGVVTSWNKGAEELFGCPASEMVGRPLSALYSEDERPRLKNQILPAVKEKENYELEVRMVRKQGEEFYARSSFTLFRCDRGLPSGVIVCVLDVTDRKRTEAELRDVLRQNRQLTKRLIALQEEEYRKLARELHDELGQSLTAIKAEAVLIDTHNRGQSKVIHESAESIVNIGNHIYDVVYSMMRRLRPSVLDDLGLIATLEAFVREWKSRRPGLPCTLIVSGDLDGLGEDVNITIYRVVQECMTNVLRHAAASQVSIALTRHATDGEKGVVRLEVKDDGRGITGDKATKTGRRFGLLGIRERVEGLGGQLRMESAPGKGLCVIATIPVGSAH